MAYDLLLRKKTSRNWACRASIMGSDDPLVWTPSAVKAEMDRIIGVLDTVNADVSIAFAEKRVSPSEWKQWRRTYETGHAFASTSSHLWGSNVVTARQHEREALKWRELVADRGGKLQGPGDLGRSKDFPTTQVALAVGGVAAAAFLITSLRKKY
jgi:hypothetical protein